MGAVEFGQLIRQARLRRGWQQQELADRIKVDRGYISTIENGKRNWPQQYVSALARELDLDEVEMAIAAGLISPRSMPSSIAEARPAYDASDPHMGRALREIATWTPEQRDLLWRYIEAVSAALDRDDPVDEVDRDRRRVAP